MCAANRRNSKVIAVARREVESRIAWLQGQLARDLDSAFDSALWYGKDFGPKPFARAELNSLASDLADARFAHAPRLHNELLNRLKPSSNAVAAQNALFTAYGAQRGGAASRH